MSNQMQDDPRVYWNEEAGPQWVRSQVVLDRILAPVTDAILTAAKLRPGERVLDLGCGSGTLALEAAERVGPDGSVVGVDVSEPLVAHARERARGRGNLDLLLADVGEDELPAADIALSRFGIMFFRNTEHAFANVRNALQPGGRCVVACWQPAEVNPWVTWPMAAIGPLLPESFAARASGDEDAPGPFRFGLVERLLEPLRLAGFAEVDVEGVSKQFAIEGTVEEILDLVGRVGPLTRILDELDPAGAALAHERVEERLRQMHDGRRIVLDAAWWVVTAAG